MVLQEIKTQIRELLFYAVPFREMWRMNQFYIGYCKFCETEQKLYYNGIQNDRYNNPQFHLLTCMDCHNTFAIPLNRLEELVKCEEDEIHPS